MRGLVLLLAGTILTATVTYAQRESLYSKIEQTVQLNDFSGVVLHHKNGRPLYAKAFGLADRPKQIVNTIDTQFNIGSINKLYTKIIIALLVQEKRLELSQTIAELLPALAANNQALKDISVFQLLTMQSGLGDYLHSASYSNDKKAFQDQHSFLPFFEQAKLHFAPGTSRKYSNLGFELLGYIISVVEGQPYVKVVKDRLFEPLGMSSSEFLTVNELSQGVAIGYHNVHGILEENSSHKSYIGTAAGGGYSCAKDFIRLSNGLRDRKVLDEKHTQLLLNNFKDNLAQDRQYLFVAGGGPGISATFYLNLEKSETVVVLSNQDPPAASTINNLFKENSGRSKKPRRKN